MSGPLPNPDQPDRKHDDVALRLDLLERENRRLRRQVEDLVGPDNPCFDRTAFQRALRFYLMILFVPVEVAFIPAMLLGLAPGLLPKSPMIGPIPLYDLAGINSNNPGLGLGIIAVGGLGVGLIAFGGMAVGVLAVGGGAVGIVAVGGGSFGLLAIGGGAIGYIAIGGGAMGRYALGGSGVGKAVFSMKRQDPEAVEFFVRWLPRLKAAITTPMPVIPLEENGKPHVL